MDTTSEHGHAAHPADHHDHQVDVLVVGGGAAGLSAALMLVRSRRTVVVVDAGEPRNAPAAGVHGFLSRDGMPPGELLAHGRAEVKHYGGDVRTGLVTLGLAGRRPVRGPPRRRVDGARLDDSS